MLNIMQHHDGITGTAKQKVSDDYDLIIRETLDDDKEVSNERLRAIAYNLGVEIESDLT